MSISRIYVDFNEMVTEDIVLLSKKDAKANSNGELVTLYEGLEIGVYSDDERNGELDYILADGVVTKYDLSEYPYWKQVKWCLKINLETGFYHESETKKNILKNEGANAIE